MNWLRKLFRSKAPDASQASADKPNGHPCGAAPAQKAHPSATFLPPELVSSERHFDIHAALRALSPERFAEVCTALPIETLDLERPDRTPQMKEAILTIFPVANYILSNGVPTGVADSVISRLVTRIEQVGPSRLHPQLADPDIWNVVIGMGKYGREQESLRCLSVLEQMVTKYSKPVCVMKYMILHNIAYDSNRTEDIDKALAAGRLIPEGQMQPNIHAAMQSLTERRATATK